MKKFPAIDIKFKLNLKFKIKTKLLIISISIVLFCFFSAFLNKYILLYPNRWSLDQTPININQNTSQGVPNQLLWWTLGSDELKLNFNSYLINENDISILGKCIDNSVQEINGENFKNLGNNFNGSFIALTNPINFDINGDGKKDTVVLISKGDTIFTRGFVPVNTFFNDERVPLELVIDGNYNVIVYFKNEPLLNADIALTYGDSSYKYIKTDSQTGMIHFDNMNILRNNINILYAAEDTYYLCSYVVEGHKLLSKEHLHSLTELAVFFGVCTSLIFILILFRELKFEGGS